jgi:uncharacterized membrane protein YqiK
MTPDIDVFGEPEVEREQAAPDPAPGAVGANLIPAGVRQQVERDVNALLNGSSIAVIETPDQRQSVNDLCEWSQKSFLMYDEQRKQIKEPHLEAGRKVDNFFRGPLDAFKSMKENCIRTMRDYDAKIEATRLEDLRKAEAVAEAERQRLAKIAADQKIEEEKAWAAAEAKRKEAEAEQDAVKRATLESEAQEAEAAANVAFQAQEQAKDAIITVEAPTVYAPVQKPKGLSVKIKYTVEVEDIEKLAKWCVENKKCHYLQGDQKALDKIAGAEEEKYSIPGTRLVKTDASRFTARRAA